MLLILSEPLVSNSDCATEASVVCNWIENSLSNTEWNQQEQSHLCSTTGCWSQMCDLIKVRTPDKEDRTWLLQIYYPFSSRRGIPVMHHVGNFCCCYSCYACPQKHGRFLSQGSTQSKNSWKSFFFLLKCWLRFSFSHTKAFCTTSFITVKLFGILCCKLLGPGECWDVNYS